MPKFSKIFTVSDGNEVIFTIGKYSSDDTHSTLRGETVIDGVRKVHEMQLSPGQAMDAVEYIKQEDAEGFYQSQKETIQ